MGSVFIPSAADFYPPPYTFENATCATYFVTPDDPQKLRDICHRFLSQPLNKPNRFELNLERVLLTFSSFPEVESSPKSAIGYLTYQEVSLIIMVYDHDREEVGMFAPMLFLDGPQAGNAEYFASSPIGLGREVYGLPKMRGEIDFNSAQFTGELRSLSPSMLNAPLKIPVFLRVSFPAQAAKADLVDQLIPLDQEILVNPTSARIKRKENLLEKIEDLKVELRDIRNKPMVGEPYHPFKLVERVWGSSVASRPLRMKAGMRDVPPEIRAALEKVKHPFDPDELESATKMGVDIGFFDALNVTPKRNSPWTAGLGFRLHGLRQLHTPGDFVNADHCDIVRSPFEYQTPSQPALNDYKIEFLEPSLVTSLGLPTSCTVQGSDVVVHQNAFAVYGDPAKTDRLTP